MNKGTNPGQKQVQGYRDRLPLASTSRKRASEKELAKEGGIICQKWANSGEEQRKRRGEVGIKRRWRKKVKFG